MLKNNIIIINFLILIFSLSIRSQNLFSQDLATVKLFNSAHSILIEGIEQGNSSRIRESVLLFQKSLEANPNYFDAIHNLSLAYFMLGDLENTQEYLSKALALRKDNFELKLLNIFLILNRSELDKAYTTIIDLEKLFPNNEKIYYLKMIYYVLIGDNNNLELTKNLISRKFGADSIYLNIYNTVNSTVNKVSSFDQDLIIANLQDHYKLNFWNTWLLTNYYLNTNQYALALPLLTNLKKSKVIFLENFAYEQMYLFSFRRGEFEQAKNHAEEYTSAYPRSFLAWKELGLAYYQPKNYALAERALNRALSLLPTDKFLQFIYDTLLKEQYSSLQKVADKRIKLLVDIGANALKNNYITDAIEYLNRALYINPLNQTPRRIIANIYIQQGRTQDALDELELLVNSGYKEDNLDSKISSLKNSVQSIRQNFEVNKELTDEFEINKKIWTLELSSIYDINDSITLPFYQKLYEYYMARSKSINWVNNSDNTNNAKYGLNISYVEDKNNIVLVHIEIKDLLSQKVLLGFERSIVATDFGVNIPQRVVNLVESLIPQVFPIIGVDTSKEKVLLDISRNDGVILKDSKYNLYSNIYLPKLTLLESSPHIQVENTQLGKIKIENKNVKYAIASLEVTNAEANKGPAQSIKYFDLLQKVTLGDFIVTIPNWQEYQSRVNISQSAFKKKHTASKVSYYLLHLYLVDFFNIKE